MNGIKESTAMMNGARESTTIMNEIKEPTTIRTGTKGIKDNVELSKATNNNYE